MTLIHTTLETTDIFRGAFFLCRGGRLESTHLSQDNRRIVSFRIIGNNLSELDHDYRSGKAKVDPLRLRESLNMLRDTLFKTLRDNERNKKNNNWWED